VQTAGGLLVVVMLRACDCHGGCGAVRAVLAVRGVLPRMMLVYVYDGLPVCSAVLVSAGAIRPFALFQLPSLIAVAGWMDLAVHEAHSCSG
jgi:hypothetical protein